MALACMWRLVAIATVVVDHLKRRSSRPTDDRERWHTNPHPFQDYAVLTIVTAGYWWWDRIREIHPSLEDLEIRKGLRIPVTGQGAGVSPSHRHGQSQSALG